MPENKLTAYEVKGNMDYEKIIKKFGASPLGPELIDKVKNPHPLLKRGYFFAHRDFDKVVHHVNAGKKFALVSGRGPSAKMHLAHLLLYKFNKYLQDEYKCYCFFPFSDDEKFLFKQNLEFKQVQELAYENALDIIALGFDPKLTEFKFDTAHMDQELYNLAIQCSKGMTFSMIQSAFGFTKQNNIGITFYPAMQAAHILYPTVKYGLPSLVTIAIDQDVFIKLTRDAAYKLRLAKPAALMSKFMKDLSGDAKMSSSNEESAIYTTDSQKEIKRKVNKAFTGGRDTIKEQKEKGGKPEACSVFEYLSLFFIHDENTIKELKKGCRAGKNVCGDCKKKLIKQVTDFLEQHQQNREKAKKKLDLFFKPKKL